MHYQFRTFFPRQINSWNKWPVFPIRCTLNIHTRVLIFCWNSNTADLSIVVDERFHQMAVKFRENSDHPFPFEFAASSTFFAPWPKDDRHWWQWCVAAGWLVWHRFVSNSEQIHIPIIRVLICLFSWIISRKYVIKILRDDSQLQLTLNVFKAFLYPWSCNDFLVRGQ